MWIKGPIPEKHCASVLAIEIDDVGKYNGKLIINRILYPEGSKNIHRAKNDLLDGEIIPCEVLGFNEMKRVLHLRWLRRNTTESVPLRRYAMTELLDRASLLKLLYIKEKMSKYCSTSKRLYFQ